jgi:3-oxoacyl-[acyl-carrier-protein] synthase-1
MKPLLVTHFTTVNALGGGMTDTWEKLTRATSGLRSCDFPGADLQTYIGSVEGLETKPIEGELEKYDCRNNRLALTALGQDGFEGEVSRAREQYGPDRVAVLIGTSTSGVLSTEEAYAGRDPASGALPRDFHYRETFNNFSVSDVVRQYLGLTGPVATVSTACSSSAKVFASASRLIEVGLCDAAVVGGVDSLCLTTLYGFSSLGLVSPQPCRPFDVDRDGLSIGEAAGFALLEPAERARDRTGVALLGYGESSDGYHMASPHPEGKGAFLAMSQSLQKAGMSPQDIDYLNLHGTATISNDRTEGKAVADIFGTSILCSSTKGWTGHCLGAAGILEAILSILCLQHEFIPQTLNTGSADPACTIQVVLENQSRTVRRVMTNSFGFGGSNCSLIFGNLS